MKKLTVVLFDDKKNTDTICERFLTLPEKSEFLGAWWIEYNQEEVYSSISMAANYFIENTDKTEIIFGISSKDYNGVVSKINTKNCEIEAINYQNL